MAALSFKKRFEPMVLDGSKYHSIRADRKDGRVPAVGEPIYNYHGMRTKQCRFLNWSRCTRVQRIVITEKQQVLIDGVELEIDEKNELAWRDGFRSTTRANAFAEMMTFWEGRLPFSGWMIWWNRNLLSNVHPDLRKRRAAA